MKSILAILTFALSFCAYAETKTDLPVTIDCTSEKGFEVTGLSLQIIGNGPEYRAKISTYSKINHMSPIPEGDYVVERTVETRMIHAHPFKVVSFADKDGNFEFNPKGQGTGTSKNGTLTATFNKTSGDFYADNLKCK